ncbi:MAG: serine/threonine-protein kinase [Myxococcota bacterium]
MSLLAGPVEPPSTLRQGRYRIHEPIGHGGVGTVFRACDLQADRDVAIKVLQPRLAGTKVERRFLREAGALRVLRHPNVVRVDDYGQEDSHTWMAMELMDRGTAHSLAKKRGGLPVTWCLHIADCVLAALQAVHMAGWVHRDVKPGNILLMRSGLVKIGDFGIIRDEGSDLTSPGVTLGTSAYMAPEQHLDATQVTPRSDLYSLGATLFALATARTPRRLAIHASGSDQVQHDPYRILPRPLRGLVRNACEIDPDKRFSDAPAMRKAVRQLLRRLR